MDTVRSLQLGLSLLLLAALAPSQSPRPAFPMQATRPVYLDDQGVIRWKDDRSEVALFGANYIVPSASDYRAAGYATRDRKAGFHFEEYIYLAGLTHKTVLIAWGGFFFRVKNNGADFKLVDDDDLNTVFPPRDETIGESSRPYGTAEVKVFDALTGKLAGVGATATANHVQIADLQSDREYTYELLVGGKPWVEVS